MRTLVRTAFALLVAGAACSHPIEPETADISGSVATIDAANSRLGVSTGKVQCFTTPCFDYSVHVTGKIFQQMEDGSFRRISLTEVETGVPVLVWTTGVALESFPAQVEGRQVVIRYYDLVTRKGRLPR